MAETRYFDIERLQKETAELGRESQNLRFRMTVELLGSTFILLWAYVSLRFIWQGFGALPLVLNAVGWTYWAVLPYLRIVHPFRRDIELDGDSSDEVGRLVFQFETRTHRLRRERALSRLIDAITAAQFVALAIFIIVPAI